MYRLKHEKEQLRPSEVVILDEDPEASILCWAVRVPLLSWLGSPTFPRSQDDQCDDCDDNDTAISAGEGWSLSEFGFSNSLGHFETWNHGRIFTKNKSCCHRGHICILDQTEMVCFFNALAPEAVG